MTRAHTGPRPRTPNELQELIGRHVSAEKQNEELALLAAQSAENQAMMAERLEILELYLEHPRRTMAAADRAAETMGVSRRQFLRLLAKYGELGPVRALTPRFRNVQRASVRRDGFSPEIEAALSRKLQTDPAAKLADISVYLRRELPPEAQPSASALRRRVLALRAQPVNTGRFGDEFIVDQAAIDLAVMSGSKRSFCMLTLMVDKATRLIVGGSATPDDRMGVGLLLALNHASATIAKQAQTAALPIASRIGHIHWIAPPGFESATGAIENTKNQPDLTLESGGKRRHGSLLLRVVGDRFGPFALRTRLTDEIRQVGHKHSLGITQADADTLVSTLIWNWNRDIIEQLPLSGSAGGQAKSRKVRSLVRQFTRFMEPVFHESLRELGIPGFPDTKR